ncbi:MAG: DUF2235 domain-containing protein [Cyanobacteria bacterium J06633_2]
MKRLIVCCDGTWQDRDHSDFPTNVARAFDSIVPTDHENLTQTKTYIRGVGTGSLRDRLPGGAFGKGIDDNILQGYEFLSQHYETGDEIYLFGFSRGAYTVRSLAGLIYCSGLLSSSKLGAYKQEAYKLYRSRAIKPSDPTAIAFREAHGDRIPITFMGCWDTVGSLGVPDFVPWLPINQWINRKYRFHDTKLSSIIQQARHAVAIDERRRALNFTPMIKSDNPEGIDQVIKQLWFPGVHGCVGGGSHINRYLSNRALLWMLEEAQDAGLVCDFTLIKGGVALNHKANFDNRIGLWRIAGVAHRNISKGGGTFETLDISAKDRWRDVEHYRPTNLQRPFGKQLDAYAAQLPNQ